MPKIQVGRDRAIKLAKARRQTALDRIELRFSTEPRESQGVTSFPAKVVDQTTRSLIDSFLQQKNGDA